jgi:hypothetical protein
MKHWAGNCSFIVATADWRGHCRPDPPQGIRLAGARVWPAHRQAGLKDAFALRHVRSFDGHCFPRWVLCDGERRGISMQDRVITPVPTAWRLAARYGPPRQHVLLSPATHQRQGQTGSRKVCSSWHCSRWQQQKIRATTPWRSGSCRRPLVVQVVVTAAVALSGRFRPALLTHTLHEQDSGKPSPGWNATP